MTRWADIARATGGANYAEKYAARFRALARDGADVHGEAAFLSRLVSPPATVLDAGCGTGRISIRLAELGYDVIGVDVDATMLEQARQEAPQLDWRLADLSLLDLEQQADLVLLAGNTIPLLEPATLGVTARRLASHMAPGGLLVCGFGLDEQHLPPGCPVTALAEVEAAFTEAGLERVGRYSTWAGDQTEDGYAVLVQRLREPTATL